MVQVSPGACLRFGDGVRLGRNTELGANPAIRIGDGTTLQDRTLLVGSVTVGRFCLFSLNVLATSGRHYFEIEPEAYIRDQDAAVFATPELAMLHDRPVVIDDDCWIGANVFIMSGVHVGKGCVVGAGAVLHASGDAALIRLGNAGGTWLFVPEGGWWGVPLDRPGTLQVMPFHPGPHLQLAIYDQQRFAALR